jgi:hypothetical protein
LYDALDRSKIYCREVRIALGVAAPIPIRAKMKPFSREKTHDQERFWRQGETASRRLGQGIHERYRLVPKRNDQSLARRLAMKCLERILLPGQETGIGR